jgi:hypothetical protein
MINKMSKNLEDLDRQLGDGVADGKISADDADTIRTFGEFLTETGPADGKTQIRRRWLPYVLGEADGPIDDPEEQKTLIERGAWSRWRL